MSHRPFAGKRREQRRNYRRSSKRGWDWNVLKKKLYQGVTLCSVQGSTVYIGKHVVVIEILIIQVHWVKRTMEESG